ncbi:MAG: transcription termination/antitermination NusG family protein, partial [Bacteroidales bacterium]|nr:transcription termination/antitermination NusG family protein [Bacteroidales bacterium]
MQDKNIEAFLPLRKTLKQWSDRKKWVEEPLFSCYIFVNVNPQEYYQAINTDGAVRYITFEGKPALVPEQQINAVKIYLNQCDAITGTFEELAP